MIAGCSPQWDPAFAPCFPTGTVEPCHAVQGAAARLAGVSEYHDERGAQAGSPSHPPPWHACAGLSAPVSTASTGPWPTLLTGQPGIRPVNRIVLRDSPGRY